MKPDITAPGLNILAAWSEVSPPTKLANDPRRVKYNLESGTSMSCPHVAAAAALVKAMYPDWSAAAIRSALMTTGATFQHILMSHSLSLSLTHTGDDYCSNLSDSNKCDIGPRPPKPMVQSELSFNQFYQSESHHHVMDPSCFWFPVQFMGVYIDIYITQNKIRVFRCILK